MAHPIFDRHTYPWMRTEARLLHSALATHIKQPGLIDVLYRECADQGLALNLGQDPASIWREALDKIALLGAVQALCTALKRQKILPVLVAVQAVEAAEPLRNQRVISDSVLMLDRIALRNSLALLEQDNSPMKVLLVRGAPGSGKSHGRHLFLQSAREHDAEGVYLRAGMIATVDELVLKLFAVLKATDKIPPRDTTFDAWCTVVCFKLQEQASLRDRRLWIAIDDLGPGPDNAPLMDGDIRRFCEKFALNLVDPSFSIWFRIMLIHYPEGKVPTNWSRDLWRDDRCNEADVTSQEVTALLRAWSAQKPDQRRILEDELHGLADQVIAEADVPPAPEKGTNPPCRLQRIDEALQRRLLQLDGASP